MITRRRFLTGLTAAASTALLPAPRETYAKTVTMGHIEPMPNVLNQSFTDMGADPVPTITFDAPNKVIRIPSSHSTDSLYRQWRQWLLTHRSTDGQLTKGVPLMPRDREHAGIEAPP